MTSGRLATLAALALFVSAAALPREVRAERPPSRVYTTADGLSAHIVSRVLADSRGFLWFATHDGLSRFDGYAFTTYTAGDGLPDRRVTSVLESRDGAYWVGTSGGLARFDPHGLRGSAEAPPFREIPLGGERGTGVISLFESADGRVWAGATNGLYLIEGEEGARVGPADDGVTEIVDDRLGGLWLGTARGELRRLRRDGGVEAVALPKGLEMEGVSALYEDSEGRLWVGRRPEETRLLDIALLPEFRNRGVGEVLLRRLIEGARRDGLPLRHMVFVLNEGAKRFYERFGFVVFEEVGAYLHMEWRPEAGDRERVTGDG